MRIVIVDDEKWARLRLKQILTSEPGVDVVAECSDACDARAAIEAYAPDAVFADIEMPGGSGLVFAREMESYGCPVVFVTAHEQYALAAFESGSIDYILKPAEAGRCRRALRRISNVMKARTGAFSGRPYLERLFVKSAGRLVHVRASDINYIEALGNYVKLHVKGKTHVLRASLSALQGRLDPSVFIRTHRSTIVNVVRVRELIAVSHGDYQIVFDDGGTAPLSRRYRDKLGLQEA